MNKLWLPPGEHWGLYIRHNFADSTGGLIGSANKVIWHTTEGLDFNSMHRVLTEKHARPHFLIDPVGGSVFQYYPLDTYSRALEHPPGTPETNRAGCIQIEVCGFAKDSQDWADVVYRHLASLAVLIEHRTGIRRMSYHPFTPPVRRLSPQGFVTARGHLGHCHVPNNTHWDPGNFQVRKLFKFMDEANKRYAH